MSRKKIIGLEKKRSALMENLVRTSEMIRGTFNKVFLKCGKPTCRCAHGKGHLSLRVTWTEKAQPKTKAIPTEDANWIKKMTENYRIFRKHRQRLRALEKKMNQLLDEFEDELVTKTRQKREYFWK